MSQGPLPQPSCSADAGAEMLGSDDEDESHDLLLDDLPDEILENVFYQLKQGLFHSPQKSGKHGQRMVREDVRTLLAVSSVSKKWRVLSQKIFFTSPWDINTKLHTFTYQHPILMFCTSPVGPRDSRSGLVKCFVKRHSAEETGGRLVISMYVGKYQSSKSTFLLSAVGRGRSSYEIYLEHGHKAHVREPCARLECNMLCTSYSLKLSQTMRSSIDNTNIDLENYDCCTGKNVLSLQYRARMRGIMQPRRMEVSLPHHVDNICGPHILHNKNPHWNEGLNCWCLNFRGRVKLASVKNFQLVHQGCDFDEPIIMQFGKIGDDVFILDFDPTIMSPIQAFGTALSTFNGRVLGLRR